LSRSRLQLLDDGEDLALPRRVQVDVDLVEQEQERSLQDGEIVDPRSAIETHQQVGDPAHDRLEPVGQQIEVDLLAAVADADVVVVDHPGVELECGVIDKLAHDASDVGDAPLEARGADLVCRVVETLPDGL
jgi:hypothetical protein